MNSKNSVKDKYLDRVNADLTRILITALRQKINDVALADVNILRVETSADLSTARVFVTGGAKELSAQTGFFRNEIAQNMKIRRVPNLRFLVDNGQANADRIEELLRQVKGETN